LPPRAAGLPLTAVVQQVRDLVPPAQYLLAASLKHSILLAIYKARSIPASNCSLALADWFMSDLLSRASRVSSRSFIVNREHLHSLQDAFGRGGF
jgi:hypothetical protein